VLTSGRWCSRGRLSVVVHVGDVDAPSGGTPLAPVPWSRTAPAPTARRLPSWRSRLRSTNDPRSSRRVAVAARSTPPSSPPSPPRSAVEQRIGEPAGVRPRGEDTGSRRPEGKESAACPGWWASRGLRRGAVAMDGDDAPDVVAGALGSFSPGETPMLAHKRGPGSACVPASGPAFPSPARSCAARGDAVRCGAGEKGEEDERRETNARVPHVSGREERKKGAGWLGCVV
jgi:hypothetical protein